MKVQKDLKLERKHCSSCNRISRGGNKTFLYMWGFQLQVMVKIQGMHTLNGNDRKQEKFQSLWMYGFQVCHRTSSLSLSLSNPTSFMLSTSLQILKIPRVTGNHPLPSKFKWLLTTTDFRKRFSMLPSASRKKYMCIFKFSRFSIVLLGLNTQD